jgi:hypothetical protein
MYLLNYIWQEWIEEGKEILFSEWDLGDGVSFGPNQEQHRDYLDWASATHGGGADACLITDPGGPDHEKQREHNFSLSEDSFYPGIYKRKPKHFLSSVSIPQDISVDGTTRFLRLSREWPGRFPRR